MNKLLEDLQKLPMSKAFLVGALLAAFYYFVMFDNGKGLDAQVAKTRAQINTKQSQINQTKKKIADGKKFEEEVNKMSMQFQEALEFLPTKLDVGDILKKISTQARSAGVNVIKVEPQEQRNQLEFYEEIYIDIELEGRYDQLTLFLANISKIQRILNVKSFDMKTDSDTGGEILSFKGQLVAYRYLEEGK